MSVAEAKKPRGRGRPRTLPDGRDSTMKFIARHDLFQAVALQCDITATAVRLWRRVPANRVISVEQAIGRPRRLIRPDIYPPE